MELYRIMLVDDEEEVRTGIIQKINWAAVGFTLVGDAENGEDALEKIDVLQPDVVLTDIRMPFMDGLSLAREIRRQYPSVKIAILSGHDEFEYAQQAIGLNVIEYILKPVNKEELTAILLRMHDTMDAELRLRRNVQQLRESYVKSLPMLREKLMQDLMHGVVSAQGAASRLRECGIDLLGAPAWVVLRLDIDVPQAAADAAGPLLQEAQLIPISVQQLLAEKLRGFCRCSSFMSTRGLCAVAALDEGVTLEGLVKQLGDVCRTARRALGVEVTAALGGACAAPEQWTVSYKQAKTAMGYKAILGTGTVISIGDVEPQATVMAPVDMIAESDFVNTLKFGTQAEMDAMVQSLVEKADAARGHRSHYQAYLLGVMNVLLQTLEKHDLQIGKVFDDEDLFELLSQLATSQELHKWLLDTCAKVRLLLTAERENTTQSIVRDAQNYLRENYASPDVSLETLCEHLHISSTYFSSVFKKETGKSYVSFLTELRLSKALELLQTTDEKTYRIAEQVGYTEPNYFGYVFKKQYGVSPAKYRTQVV